MIYKIVVVYFYISLYTVPVVKKEEQSDELNFRRRVVLKYLGGRRTIRYQQLVFYLNELCSVLY